MASNFPGLFEIIKINNAPFRELDPINLSKNLVSLAFPHFPELLENQVLIKILEKPLESPIKALIGGLNVDSGVEFKNIFPGIFAGLSTGRGGASK